MPGKHADGGWGGPAELRRRTPRVRFLVHGAERSGPPIYALRLVREWQRHPPPFLPEVVVARPGPLVDELATAAPTAVARLDPRSPERFADRAATAIHLHGLGRWIVNSAVRARIGGDEPDLTVVNGATAPTVDLLASLAPSGRVVTIAHELSTGWFSNLTETQRQLLIARTSAFLAVSEAVRSFLVERLGVPIEAVSVVPPPVECSGSAGTRRTPADSSTRLVAGMGMTDWRKAPETWLRIANLVRSTPGHEAVRFIWVGGDSPDSQAFWPLEHEMIHLGLGEHVRFAGTVADPWELVGAADVLVSTAREDAYPLACAEAIARGIPVVGFDVDGVGEMVRASGCGAVVPYPDEPGLAAAVTGLIADEEHRAAMSSAGQEFAARVLSTPAVARQVGDWIEGNLR